MESLGHGRKMNWIGHAGQGNNDRYIPNQCCTREGPVGRGGSRGGGDRCASIRHRGWCWALCCRSILASHGIVEIVCPLPSTGIGLGRSPRAAIYDQAVGARLALEPVTVVGGSLVMKEKAAASGDKGRVLLSVLDILVILAALSRSQIVSIWLAWRGGRRSSRVSVLFLEIVKMNLRSVARTV